MSTFTKRAKFSFLTYSNGRNSLVETVIDHQKPEFGFHPLACCLVVYTIYLQYAKALLISQKYETAPRIISSICLLHHFSISPVIPGRIETSVGADLVNNYTKPYETLLTSNE